MCESEIEKLERHVREWRALAEALQEENKRLNTLVAELQERERYQWRVDVR